MLIIHPRAARRLLAVSLFWLATAPVKAQMDSQQFKTFRQESETFNRQDPFANAYRAGHYNGYLAGVIDALQGRRICFRECVCEIDKLVAQQLADRPEIQDRPVVEWLVPLLEQKYPCK